MFIGYCISIWPSNPGSSSSKCYNNNNNNSNYNKDSHRDSKHRSVNHRDLYSYNDDDNDELNDTAVANSNTSAAEFDAGITNLYINCNYSLRQYIAEIMLVSYIVLSAVTVRSR